jgi:hypothetical protein
MSVATPTFSLSYGGAFTYSVWINKQVQPVAGIVLMTGSGASGNFITIIQGMSTESFGTNMQGSAWVNISCAHTLNTWDNYVATYSAGAMSWYKNGVLQSTGMNSYTSAATQNLPLYIGKGISSGNFLGEIDDIGIWDRVLTGAEISGLYDLTTTHVADRAANEPIAIAPDPASDRITLNVDPGLVGAHYDLCDATGRVVMSGTIGRSDMTLDVSDLRPGICFMRITLNDRAFMKTVIIQR